MIVGILCVVVFVTMTVLCAWSMALVADVLCVVVWCLLVWFCAYDWDWMAEKYKKSHEADAEGAEDAESDRD